MLRNIIEETAAAPGAATSFALNGPTTGRLPWIHAQTFATLDVVFYAIEGAVSGAVKVEWGIGKVTAGPPTVFERTQVVGNSDGTTNRLNFTGAVRVYNDVPAEHMTYMKPVGLLKASPAQIGGALWATMSGGPNDLVVNTPESSTLRPGTMILCYMDLAPTGLVTVNVNGAGALPLYTSERLRQANAGDWSADALVVIVWDGARWRMVNAAEPGLIPVGTWLWTSSQAVPKLCLTANGQNVSRTSFARLHALYAADGYPYGSGNGSTTFGVPDLRGRSLFARDNLGGNSANRLTNTLGASAQTLGYTGGDDRAQAHAHSAITTSSSTNEGLHSHQQYTAENGSYGGGANSGFDFTGGLALRGQFVESAGSHSHTITSTTTVASNLSGNSQNMPPFMLANAYVFAGE